MGYLKKIEYEIVLEDSFWVVRNCPKCGRKTHYKNTEKFRVNANGSKLDVWLIYQCEECKHTLNLAIYERRKVSLVPKEEYRRFLDNDEQLAQMYGRHMPLFLENKAEIDFDRLQYRFVKQREIMESSDFGAQVLLTIKNPFGLKLRREKQIAEVLGLSRSQVKALLEEGKIEWKMELPQQISAGIDASLFHAGNSLFQTD